MGGDIKVSNAVAGFGRKWLFAYTLVSALAVWLGLAVAEGRARERCGREGLQFHWITWSCVPAGGTIILPSELKRASAEHKKAA